MAVHNLQETPPPARKTVHCHSTAAGQLRESESGKVDVLVYDQNLVLLIYHLYTTTTTTFTLCYSTVLFSVGRY